MLAKLLAAFILIPLIEFILLVEMAARTSFATTFLVVVATGILGSFLARREGLQTWKRFHLAMNQGRVPSEEIQDGLMIVFAGALLLTPGLLTDAVGFLLLIPQGRGVIRGFVLSRYKNQVDFKMSSSHGFQMHTQSENQHQTPHPLDRHDAIDVEVVRKKDS